MKLAKQLLLCRPCVMLGRGLDIRNISTGIDNFRQVLQQLRNDVEVEAACSRREDSTVLGQSFTGTLGTCKLTSEGVAPSLLRSSSLIKQLLRVFTRKVPGGLVPDGLIRGFMQAYQELAGSQERLVFFRLVSYEMGLSVPEVCSAIHLWDAARTRALPQAAMDDVAATAEVQAQAAPQPPSTPSSTIAAAVADAPPEALFRAADRLSSACRPLYTQLFLSISQAPQGMKFLVDLRADLLELTALVQQQQQQQSASLTSVPLRAMAEHLRHSLAEWFSVGLLQLQAISWRESPAALLERVMHVEAVHPLSGWEELRRRLGPRRRVFAFTHPSMPGEPLVVLHTALMDRPAAYMTDILDEEQQHQHGVQQQLQPQQQHHQQAAEGEGSSHKQNLQPSVPLRGAPTAPPPPSSDASCFPLQMSANWHPSTAVFYSISSSQSGLRGIDLGQFLIKRVAECLMAEFPSIRRLVTLSPLPNFRTWLVSRLRQEQSKELAGPAIATGVGDGLRGGEGAGGDSGGMPVTAEGKDVRTDGGADRGSTPLMHTHEVEAVERLATAMGWTGPGTPVKAGEALSSVPAGQFPAAEALCWLLQEDRWLHTLECRSHPCAKAPGVVARNCGDVDGSDLGGGTSSIASAEAVMRPLLMRLAARYLASEKRRRFALCPVAHFHLRNGASLWRLNWGADMSRLGLERSFGIMVNYEYDLPMVYDNNWKYIMLHEIQAHPKVLELL